MANVEKEFVLRHTFNKFSTLEEQSSPYHTHFGVPWNITIAHTNYKTLAIFLYCNPDLNSNLWKIEVQAQYRLISTNEEFLRLANEGAQDTVTFSQEKNYFQCDSFDKNDEFVKKYVKNDGLTAEIRIKIVKMTGFIFKQKKNFDEPNGKFTDVCLVVDKKKFYVGKMMLAEQSPVFEAMFFGDFVEAESKKVVIEDTKADSFEVFLSLIYITDTEITARNVEELLKLADRYDVSCVFRECENFLMENEYFSVRAKLNLSVKYSLVALQIQCLNKRKDSGYSSILEHKPDPEPEFVLRHTFKNFSKLEKQFSPIMTHFGIPWSIKIDRTSNKNLQYSLHCHLDVYSYCWEIDVQPQYGLISKYGKFLRFGDDGYPDTFTFNPADTSFGYDEFASIDEVVKKCVENDELTAEIRVKIVRLNGVSFKKKKNFNEPNGKMTDACLVVKGKKFHVNKMILAERSPVFEAMFFGESVEAKSDEVVIEDTKADTFDEFLSLVYSTDTEIHEENVEDLLKLADRFKVSRIIQECEQYLLTGKFLLLEDKLILSEKYSFASVQSKCLSDLTSIRSFECLKGTVKEMGEKTAKALLERALDLI